MARMKKLAEDATTNAMLAAGKEAAERAARDLLSSDEERAARATEEAEASKKRRTKLVVIGVLGLCVVIGVLGMLVSYWHWFLLAGILGLGGIYGRWRWRRHRATKLEQAPVRAEEAREAQPSRVDEAAPEREAEQRARDAHARTQARAEEEAEVEDELAALKARLGK